MKWVFLYVLVAGWQGEGREVYADHDRCVARLKHWTREAARWQDRTGVHLTHYAAMCQPEDMLYGHVDTEPHPDEEDPR